MKNKKLLAFLIIVLVYIVLLFSLVSAEIANEGSSITSLPLALWYSLVTMTTVGYGDLYPVTVVGKLIGVLFLLLSAGALTAVISFGISWITGTGYPKMKFRNLKNQNVYVFDCEDDASTSLSANIESEDKDALCIFANASSSRFSDKNYYVPMQVAEIIKSLVRLEKKPTVIFTEDDAQQRLSHCDLPQDVNIVCKSQLIPEEIDETRRFYDRDELCTSMYWHNNPIGINEKTIILIGFGNLGRKLLEYALENCILSPVRSVTYHVFGDAEEFLNDHPNITPSVSLNIESDDRDSLIIHKDSWNSSKELLFKADRVLICSDNENENLSTYQRLITYFPTKAKLHLYNTGILDDNVPSFGSDTEVYSVRAVLRSGLEATAKKMHEIYCDQSGMQMPAWEKLSAFTRRSNYASAQHINEKVRYLLKDDTIININSAQLHEAYNRFKELKDENPDICRMIEHDRWMRFHSMYNWAYCDTRDNFQRLHPLMVPFNQLSPVEQAKDDYAWELIETLANY